MPEISNYSTIENPAGFAGAVVGFGGATAPSAMTWLKDEGYRTVVNLRHESEEGVNVEACRNEADAAGLRYVYLPFDPREADSAVIDEFLNTIGNPDNQPVYIYCNTATRVAALWMIARIQKDGFTIEAATEEAERIAAKPEQAIAFATSWISR